jgi:hypothetical protein
MKGNIKTCSYNNFQRRKEMCSELLWEFVDLIIQHANLMHPILLSSVAYLSVA